MTQRYRMTVAYDGTAYAGWQIQPGQVTVQSELERAIRELAGEVVRVHCSGRTDAGVHARSQVTHFDLRRPAGGSGLRAGLNALLAADIRVLSVRTAASDFHARKSAQAKQYRYFIWDGPVLPPTLRLYRHHCRRRLDVEAMRQAARHLLGEHDFSAFTANPNRDVPSAVRDLRRLDVKRHGHDVALIAESGGFLYKMVRSLAGFLLRVGEGAVPPDQTPAILASRARTARVPTAPARGLFLWEVRY